jgi:hypothetical protein
MNSTNEFMIEGNQVQSDLDCRLIELNELQLVLVGGGSGDPILA